MASKLMESESVEKIIKLDEHIAGAMSGFVADARTMIDFARVEAQNHWFTYDERMKTSSIAQAICGLALRFGESGDGEGQQMSRPLGVALLVAGVDEDGPQLYHVDPSGTCTRYYAKAIGAGSEGAQGELQEHYYKDITLQEAQLLAVRILKRVMEEKIDTKNLQLALIVPEKQTEEGSEELSVKNSDLISKCGLSAQRNPGKKEPMILFISGEQLSDIISKV